MVVYFRIEECVVEFVGKYGAVYYFISLKEMVESEVYDVVYFVSLNVFYKEQVIFFMEYGKYVLCEKLFVFNVREMEDMIYAVKVNGVFLMEVMKMMFLLNFSMF